ncbi:RNA polymerase sigma-70 factor [Chitinophaga oryzae]|uniref:RNA polymerase sigma-70 factor n=1 Tax=Chitinophaga oryzae TaxID=2725414 RepID=A0AAE7D945_9BACT|nr:RNA polymerase sigma-70 factor [Chitinophaga oryzae]QJB32808.1 RNA polymerase sigma-70 factor [Chitinophaga oryzae]QJB39261.1 RNA polymerase sigma-70 factor [Chitinophaga oryzae]
MQETPFSLEQFELLFKEHFKPLALLAYSVVKDKDVAKDIVQEFFVKFWETQHTLQLRGPFEGYAARAVKNRSLNYIARQEVQDKHRQLFAAMPPDDQDTGHADREQFYQRLSHAIDCMPEQRRRVFLMSAADNKKYADIARELNISINTVKFHIKAAYVFLRNEAFMPLWISILLNMLYFFEKKFPVVPTLF